MHCIGYDENLKLRLRSRFLWGTKRIDTIRYNSIYENEDGEKNFPTRRNERSWIGGMFKKFTTEDSISSTSQIKNSVQRSIITQLVNQYPLLEDAIESLLPKKAMMIAKCQDNIQLIIVNNEIVFYNQMNGPFFPTLKVLHKYPSMMDKMQVDKGAIRFILSGSNIMCPGFTSKGGLMATPIEEEKPVAIYAEGKVNAMAVGLTKMSTERIKSVNKGIAVENVHYLMDGLWQTKSV